jgi:hypothetical protein
MAWVEVRRRRAYGALPPDGCHRLARERRQRVAEGIVAGDADQQRRLLVSERLRRPLHKFGEVVQISRFDRVFIEFASPGAAPTGSGRSATDSLPPAHGAISPSNPGYAIPVFASGPTPTGCS